MAKSLVIVESPAKAKTIEKFLGKSHYTVKASVGHVRDLPKSQLGVDIENNFEPKYINIRGKGDVIKELKKEAKKAKKVYLATDPDREGEAISWHLSYILNIDEEEKMMTQQTGEAEPNKNKYETSLKLLKFFEKFAEVNKLDFKFAIARVNTFSSNRQKMEKYPIYISLAENDTATFKELMYEKETSISSVNENKMSDLHLFYVFTSKENLHKARENGKEITRLLTDFIHAYDKWE